MSLRRWKNRQREGHPAESPLAMLREDMDRLFDRFLREPLGQIDWPFGPSGQWSPAVDIAETDKEVTVRAELPGIGPDDVDVTISGNQLVLAGEKKETEEHGQSDCYHSESRYGSFRRSIALPESIDPERVTADYHDGILTIHLEKSPASPTKRIRVQTKSDQA